MAASAEASALCSGARPGPDHLRLRQFRRHRLLAGLRGAGDSEEQALQLLDHARRLGLRRFDTANTYGGGASETVLGKWLRAQGAAFLQAVQVATKVGNPHGCPPGETPLSRTQIAYHLDRSLRRLGVERIDLYYMHEFDRVTPLDETLEAMRRAVDAGKIALFGVSNASLADVEAVRDSGRRRPRRALSIRPE